jgi:polar amino acid transport system substrate-binding protein
MKYKALVLALLLSAPVTAKDLFFVGQEYPPFNWSEGSEVKGGVVEVMKMACERLEHHCKFGIVPLARGISMLKNGTADGVMSLIPNSDRTAFSLFSPTLVVSNVGYFGVKGKVKKLANLKELEGWTVGAVRASSSLKIAAGNQKQLKNMTLEEEVNTETMLKKLQHNRYGEKGVIIGDNAVLAYEAKKLDMELELVLDGEAQAFMTAFSKKSVDAKTFADFTKTLDAMKKSGEVKAILAKFGLRTD